ncbi:MAG: Rho termination factor N-terminal domain-containing protein, partial [Ilumatobacter sp.]
LELNRAAPDRTISTNRRNLELLLGSVQTVAKTTDTGVRTVAGTIRWTVSQTVDAATTGVRRVTGQTKAQVRIAVDTLDDQVSDIADEVADRLDATIASTKAADTRDEKAHLNAKTKDELYEQAQLLEIDGRADMTKAQLVNAIAKAV